VQFTTVHLIRARSVRRNPVDFYNFRWIFRIQWISIFLLNATTLNPGKNPAKRVLPLEVNHFSLDTGFRFFFYRECCRASIFTHIATLFIDIHSCYTHHFYSSSPYTGVEQSQRMNQLKLVLQLLQR
jgi:hypothetical protein